MNTVSYFEIHSSDPEREISFYQAVFQWKFTKDEMLPLEYYRIETGGINGGLLKRPASARSTAQDKNAFVCSIMVENFDRTSEVIIRNGGKIALPKFAIPGKCWQGYFIDPDNNGFGIFELDESAR